MLTIPKFYQNRTTRVRVSNIGQTESRIFYRGPLMLIAKAYTLHSPLLLLPSKLNDLHHLDMMILFPVSNEKLSHPYKLLLHFSPNQPPFLSKSHTTGLSFLQHIHSKNEGKKSLLTTRENFFLSSNSDPSKLTSAERMKCRKWMGDAIVTIIIVSYLYSLD